MDLSPLNRNNKYFSEDEFQYYLDIAREHMASIDVKVKFIKIDKSKSQVDDLYGEGYIGELHYEEPVEVPAIIKLESPENKAYVEDKGMFRYEEYGNLVVNVLLDDLEKLNVDISYGDIVGYQLTEDETIYFEVANDSKKHHENSKTFFGYKPLWKTITCTPKPNFTI